MARHRLLTELFMCSRVSVCSDLKWQPHRWSSLEPSGCSHPPGYNVPAAETVTQNFYYAVQAVC